MTTHGHSLGMDHCMRPFLLAALCLAACGGQAPADDGGRSLTDARVPIDASRDAGRSSDATVETRNDGAADASSTDGGSDAGPPPDRWVSTWSTTLIDQGFASPVPGASAITLRQVVHTSVGGRQVRVRLSNAFSDSALRVEAAHVAVRDTGANIVASTDRTLHFAGATAITIPARGAVVSDAVDLAVPALGDLAISIELPNPFLGPTQHPSAFQTAYVSNALGRSGSTQLAIGSTNTSWTFLDGVDVLGGPTGSTIVTLGDSITDGASSSNDQNQRWPDELARRLVAAGSPRAVANEGLGANGVVSQLVGQPAVTRFERDVLGNATVSHLIVLEGINDIGAANVTSEALIAGYRQLMTKARTAGIRIYLGTIAPFEGAGYFSQAKEAVRSAVNQWIRTTTEADGFIDFDAAVRDPASPTRFSAAYDSGDHLHPSDAGYRAMGQAISLALFE